MLLDIGNRGAFRTGREPVGRDGGFIRRRDRYWQQPRSDWSVLTRLG
jgi:hypothetical protein